MATFYSPCWENSTAIVLFKKEEQWFKIESNNSNWDDGFRVEPVSLTEAELEGVWPYKRMRQLTEAEVGRWFDKWLPLALQALQTVNQ